MEKFSLIKKLDEIKDAPPTPLAKGISYQQYELEVDGKIQLVNIPLKETDAFENTIVEEKDPLNRKSLKRILREHRGVRG
jgi:hypothetical protein